MSINPEALEGFIDLHCKTLRLPGLLNPFTYLTYLFEQLPNSDLSDKDNLDCLLHWSTSILDNCKLRK